MNNPCIYCKNYKQCIAEFASTSDMIDKRLLNCLILDSDCFVESRDFSKELMDLFFGKREEANK